MNAQFAPASPEDAIAAAQADGWAAIAPGVYLYSTAGVMAEGFHEDPDDRCYGVDFKVAPYWITTDCGARPIPVFGAHDADLLAVLA